MVCGALSSAYFPSPSPQTALSFPSPLGPGHMSAGLHTVLWCVEVVLIPQTATIYKGLQCPTLALQKYPIFQSLQGLVTEDHPRSLWNGRGSGSDTRMVITSRSTRSTETTSWFAVENVRVVGLVKLKSHLTICLLGPYFHTASCDHDMAIVYKFTSPSRSILRLIGMIPLISFKTLCLKTHNTTQVKNIHHVSVVIQLGTLYWYCDL